MQEIKIKSLILSLLLFVSLIFVGATDIVHAETNLELTDVYVEDNILNLKFAGINDSNKNSIKITLDGTLKDNSFEYNIKIPTKLVVEYNNGVKTISETFQINNNNTVYKGNYKIEPLKLNYLYVEDGIIYSNFTGLKLSNMFNIKVTLNDQVLDKGNISNIKTTVPSTIKYEYNGETKSFNIGLYNEILYGEENIPLAIKERIKEKSLGKMKEVDGFINVKIGEFGTRVNVYDVFEEYIKELYGKYNKKDILITSPDVSVDKEFLAPLSKDGLIRFQISHSFYNKDKNLAYIYVDNGSVKYTNINSVLVKNIGLVDADEIKLINLLDFDLIKNNYEPNTEYLLARDVINNTPLTLTDEIELKNDVLYKYEILDLLTSTRYQIEFIKFKPNETNIVAFKDVTNKHWAYHSVKNMAFKSLVNGFPDGTFKPEKNMTLREFNTLLSRIMLLLDEDLIKPMQTNVDLSKISGDWGYTENKAVLGRLTQNELSKFDYSNLNRPITRQEVAFLLDKTIEINKLDHLKKTNSSLTDVNSLKYKDSVKLLNEYGIIKGYPDKTFKGNQNITRAEICTIIERIIGE